MDINFNTDNSELILKEKINIIKQQRNGKKCNTYIENFADNLEKSDIKKFLRIIKKNKCCNGSYDSEKKIIQLQGDCVDFIKELIINQYDYNEDEITIKGV